MIHTPTCAGSFKRWLGGNLALRSDGPADQARPGQTPVKGGAVGTLLSCAFNAYGVATAQKPVVNCYPVRNLISADRNPLPESGGNFDTAVVELTAYVVAVDLDTVQPDVLGCPGLLDGDLD